MKRAFLRRRAPARLAPASPDGSFSQPHVGSAGEGHLAAASAIQGVLDDVEAFLDGRDVLTDASRRSTAPPAAALRP